MVKTVLKGPVLVAEGDADSFRFLKCVGWKALAKECNGVIDGIDKICGWALQIGSASCGICIEFQGVVCKIFLCYESERVLVLGTVVVA